MSVAIPLFQEGTRVRVKRGTSPLDPGLIGRSGTVLRASEYAVHLYDVLLDGEQRIYTLSPSELETLEPLALPPERERAKGRLSRP